MKDNNQGRIHEGLDYERPWSLFRPKPDLAQAEKPDDSLIGTLTAIPPSSASCKPPTLAPGPALRTTLHEGRIQSNRTNQPCDPALPQLNQKPPALDLLEGPPQKGGLARRDDSFRASCKISDQVRK